MIQRIQSIFLLLAAVAFSMLFLLPFGVSDQPESGMLSDSRYDVYDHVLLMVLAGLGGLIAFIGIFLFKNRKRQVSLSYIGIISAILLPILVIALFAAEAGSMEATSVVEERLGLVMPLVAIIFLILAIRFIRKDDKLVRSMDRLR